MCKYLKLNSNSKVFDFKRIEEVLWKKPVDEIYEGGYV